MGRSLLAAMFMDSWNVPSSMVPSPKKDTVTRPSFRSCDAMAVPAAMGRVAATEAPVPMKPTDGSSMCMEPPRPRAQPSRVPTSLVCGARPVGALLETAIRLESESWEEIPWPRLALIGIQLEDVRAADRRARQAVRELQANAGP